MSERAALSDHAALTRIIVNGAEGRMGDRLCRLARADDRVALVGALTHPGSARLGAIADGCESDKNPLKYSVSSDADADVVIDFSTPEGTLSALETALEKRAALLVGTTGLDQELHARLREASAGIAVLTAPNTSLGVAVLADATRRAAALLGNEYRCAVVEAHHSGKKDAPSGTALRLAEAARSAGADLPDDQILSIRAGDVVGEHTVRFAGPGEYIELTHRATTRDVFVLGALRAAKWLHGKPPGMWKIEDVLGITST